jgi:hypothetical protein
MTGVERCSEAPVFTNRKLKQCCSTCFCTLSPIHIKFVNNNLTHDGRANQKSFYQNAGCHIRADGSLWAPIFRRYRVLLQKPIFRHVVKELLAFYEIRKLITAFCRGCQWSLSNPYKTNPHHHFRIILSDLSDIREVIWETYHTKGHAL